MGTIGVPDAHGDQSALIGVTVVSYHRSAGNGIPPKEQPVLWSLRLPSAWNPSVFSFYPDTRQMGQAWFLLRVGTPEPGHKPNSCSTLCYTTALISYRKSSFQVSAFSGLWIAPTW